MEFARSCPNTDYLLPGTFSEAVRRPLSNLVEGTCPSRRLRPRTITAAHFQTSSAEHRALVAQLGVTMTTLPDGRVQLLHTAANVSTLPSCGSCRRGRGLGGAWLTHHPLKREAGVSCQEICPMTAFICLMS